MPRRQQFVSNEDAEFKTVPYDFSLVPNCVASDEGLQASVLEEVVTRAEWTSSVAELVGLSHEAAGRRARKTGSFRGIHHNNAEAERLSFSFIAERTQTDDPIEGFMIRTKDRARHLQGFLWFTNFTTWTHFFRWDSLASKAELHGRAQRDGISWDADGSLSAELELQQRDGDPNDQVLQILIACGQGVIWPRVAEIALVGGLECGGFLVQLALEALERSMSYDFVVVQATESSAGFYDRMGFRRVGALAKYITSDVAPHQARTVAYRHWAYPDEDVSKMDSSIMMAIKLRAGQVVQRIMASEGGIFPNRQRFMDRQPARGVLSLPRNLGVGLPQSSTKDRPVSAPAAGMLGAPLQAVQGTASTEALVGAEGSKEVARRSQACRPWVCYGNPSAICQSPKRRREGASNQLHRSIGSVVTRSDHSPSFSHAPSSATSRRNLVNIRGVELRPSPQAPRGVFRPSKRKSPNGDPCVTVDREPAGTAPESDLTPGFLGFAAPPQTQRPRRDRSGYGERRYAGYPPPPPPPSRSRPVAVAVRSYPAAEVSEPDIPVVNGPTLAETAPGPDHTTAMETPSSAGTTNATVPLENVEVAIGSAAEVVLDLLAAPALHVEDSSSEMLLNAVAESNVNGSKSPLRAVAIRRYPPPMQNVGVHEVVDENAGLHEAGDAQTQADLGPAARKAGLACASRRHHRSKPRLALRMRYEREAEARALIAQRRMDASEMALHTNSVERMDLAPLPVCVRSKLERAVPDLLSAAGVVSTKGPFDCDEEAGLPALSVPAEVHGGPGTDSMALPMLEGVDVFERCTCFELMIAGEDRPCCDFCANCAKLHDDDHGESYSNENDSFESASALKGEVEQEGEQKGYENEDDADEDEEEVGVACKKQPRQRLPVSKFRFQHLKLRVYPRKGGQPLAAKHMGRTAQKVIVKRPSPGNNHSWRNRHSKETEGLVGCCPLVGRDAVANLLDSKTNATSSGSELDGEEQTAVVNARDESADNIDVAKFGASVAFPPYPWATEDDGPTVCAQVWRPMQCPFALLEGVVHATRGYEAVAPLQGKRPLIVTLSTPTRSACCESECREQGSGSASDEEDVKCCGCHRTDREEEMMLCDNCDAGWHLDCLTPPLASVPNGDWLCPECCEKVQRVKAEVPDKLLGNCDTLHAEIDGGRRQHLCTGRQHVRVVPMRNRQPVLRFKFPRQRCVSHLKSENSSNSSADAPPSEIKVSSSPRDGGDHGSASVCDARSKTPSTHRKISADHHSKAPSSTSTRPSPNPSPSARPNSTPQTTPKSAQPLPNSHRKKVNGAIEFQVKLKARNEDILDLPQGKTCANSDSKSSTSTLNKGRGTVALSGCGSKLGAVSTGQTIKFAGKREEAKVEKPSSVDLSDRLSSRALEIRRQTGASSAAGVVVPSFKDLPLVHEPLVGRSGSDDIDVGFWRKIRSESLRRICEDVGAAASGNRTLLISRILSRLDGCAIQGCSEVVPASEDLSRLRMSTLRRLCGDLAISMNGNKEALIWRLVAVFSAESEASLELSKSTRVACKVDDSSQVGMVCSCDAPAIVPNSAHIWQEWPCDGCGRADREDQMVLCDLCDAGWHLDCLSPALSAVPDGDWLCPECAVGQRDSRSRPVLSAAEKRGRAEGSRKRVRYAMLRTSTARNPDRFELSSGRSSRSMLPTKRQRVPVARFRFSGIEAASL